MSHEFRWIEWNREKMAKHGVEPEEAEYVVNHAKRPYPMKADDEKRLVWDALAVRQFGPVVPGES